MSDPKNYLNKETVLEAISISKLIVDENMVGKQLSNNRENNDKYNSIIFPRIEIFKSQHNKKTPNQLLNLFLHNFLSIKGYYKKYESKSFHYCGQIVSSYVWGAITKIDANIKEYKSSYYPQLYILINDLDIHFGFCYGSEVKEDNECVLFAKTDNEIKQKIINLLNNNRDLHIFPSYDHNNHSVNQEIKFNNIHDIEDKWTKDVHIINIIKKDEINDNIDITITNTFEKLFELLLKTSEVVSKNPIEPKLKIESIEPKLKIESIEPKTEPIESKPKIASDKKQVILYGPPGTGKTYNSIILAHDIIFGSSDISITYPKLQAKLRENSKEDVDVTQISSWLDAIMWAFREIDKEKIKLKEIKNSKIIKEYGPKTNSKKISNTIQGTLQNESRLDSKTVNVKDKSGRELFDKNSDVTWYLTEKGKEYMNILCGDSHKTSPTSSSQFTFVTFHQSYSYEDFVEGIRPSLDDADGSQIRYKVKPGIFKEICNNAKHDEDNNYVLVIDEINRGNISKIFGELITLLEDNKRSGEKEAITVILPYSNEEFSVPTNVYLIGTMNSTDKSIALVDVALRRRFDFERMDVEYDLIQNDDAKKMLKELNGIICALKNPDFEIGHSYFMNVPKDDEGNQELKKVFDTKILPLIEEYFFNDWEALATILGPDSIQIKKRKKIIWDEDSQEFKKESGEYDKIHGRCIDSKNSFERTLKNLKILNKFSDSPPMEVGESTEFSENYNKT